MAMAPRQHRSPLGVALLTLALVFGPSFVVSPFSAVRSPSRSRLALHAEKLEPGDYVKAWYHQDNGMHAAILLDIEKDGDEDRYIVTWDEPDENEPITGTKQVELIKKASKPIKPVHKQIFNIGDKITAYFLDDKNFYAADIIGKEGDKWKIRWEDPDGSPPEELKPPHELKLVRRIKDPVK
mmetsp:Transcript_104893/g.186578  ORF Transcript_104893/g.186578 Transcript_104893/m.186578 type:complete len:182 (+) Transcript_104893:30-575(+)